MPGLLFSTLFKNTAVVAVFGILNLTISSLLFMVLRRQAEA
jgi:hypothetical protein